MTDAGDDTPGETTPTGGRLPAEAGVGRVALRVNDLERLTGFYRDVVGLAVRERRDGRAVLGTARAPLLELAAAPDAPPRGPDEAGLFHVAVRVPTRAALGRVLERVEADWRLSGASDHRVSEALYLRDPEDNGVEIYRDRPRSAWPQTGDGGVAMDTLPLDLGEVRAAADGGEGGAGRGEGGAGGEESGAGREGGGAGTGAGPGRVPPATTVGHVHLETTDLPAAREFYVDGLGLGVRQEWGRDALFLAAGDYHHHLGVNAWHRRTEPRRPGARGLEWFEVLVPDRAALAGVRERFERAGVGVRDGDGGLRVTDPDGTELRVRVGDGDPGT